MSRIATFFRAFAISSAFAPALVSAATLTITISDIRENEGQVMIQVASCEKEFQSDGGLNSKAASLSQRGQAGEMTFQISLPEGVYAAQVMHDLNGNGELDANFLGMPREPWAFSNNAVGRRGPAKWEDAKFEISADTTLEIRLNH